MTFADTALAVDIRTRPGNTVPACVTPERLMAFVATRNTRLHPRYTDIARLYRLHGDAWRVRWDYAFFQMVVETNALSFRRPDGRTGDVNPRQNNFAGLGATGGGVPGDAYPSMSTGVLAQIQHLVAYSGERLADPVGPRTRLKQDDIIAISRGLGRPVRFADLARRWAADARYGATIEGIAQLYRDTYCTGAAAAPGPAARRAAAPRAAADAPAFDESRSMLGGDPQIRREPVAAQRLTAPAVAKPPQAGGGQGTSTEAGRTDAGRTEAGSKASVRTVWQSRGTGDMPPPPSERPANDAPRRVAVVAAGDAAAAPTSSIQPLPPVSNAARSDPIAEFISPIEPTSIAPLAPLLAPTAPKPTAITDLPPVPFDEQPSIAISAAASPFVGGSIVFENQTAKGRCRVVMASYGGTRAVVIRSDAMTTSETSNVELVVLSVVPGFEETAARNYIRTRAPGGGLAGAFPGRDEALAYATSLCVTTKRV